MTVGYTVGNIRYPRSVTRFRRKQVIFIVMVELRLHSLRWVDYVLRELAEEFHSILSPLGEPEYAQSREMFEVFLERGCTRLQLTSSSLTYAEVWAKGYPESVYTQNTSKREL